MIWLSKQLAMQCVGSFTINNDKDSNYNNSNNNDDDNNNNNNNNNNNSKLCGRPPQYAPAPCKSTFDLLTLTVVSESCVTWATSAPILVFLSLSVLDFGPMYATDRQTSDIRRASSLNAPTLGAWV